MGTTARPPEKEINMADDATNNAGTPVAPEVTNTPSEQGTAPETAVIPPDDSQDKGELLLGKFKSQDDLVKSYKEMESEYTKARQQLKEREAAAGNVPVAPATEAMTNAGEELFDPETEKSLQTWYSKQREAEKTREFIQKHSEELADPLLSGAVTHLIREANKKGQYMNQEDALSEAKKMLDERTKPKVEEAKTAAFADGQEIARKKEQAGAVGEGKPNKEVDPDTLSAAEFAEYHGISRV